MVLGKDVLNKQGIRVGTVADVGLHDLRRVKYLLIDHDNPTPELQFMRLGVERIKAITNQGIVVVADDDA